jgi:hypothetical protein
MSVSIYFVPEGQITQPTIVIMCQIVTEENTSLLVSDELDNIKCDALLPVKDRGRSCIFYEVCSL